MGMRMCSFLLDVILIIAVVATLLVFSYSDAEMYSYIDYYERTMVESTKAGFDPSKLEGYELFYQITNFVIGNTLLYFWLYFTLSECFMNGSSLGKKAFSLRVIKRYSNHRPSVLDSALRSGIKSLTFLALLTLPQPQLFALLSIDYLVAFFRIDNRTIHDILSRTWVVVPTNGKLLEEIT